MVPKNRVTSHPGEILREEFMFPEGITIEQLSQETDLSIETVRSIVEEKMLLNPYIARQLAERFGTSVGFWTKLDLNYYRSLKAMEKRQETVEEDRKGAEPQER